MLAFKLKMSEIIFPSKTNSMKNFNKLYITPFHVLAHNLPRAEIMNSTI